MEEALPQKHSVIGCKATDIAEWGFTGENYVTGLG
ncbi:hypothetical protein METH_16025 [Leisingera methylohalidivorans DSM 14336]|uniref:Uncharacterized protein n=1 Tax=Leisingera methylohalidivorans DSM 14336 TaxID=999552 RepID=V9W0M0_9RHOB|nr:hypothetical protein METH_16025 [Leisingera methylohalidivorans DSM 14336]